MSQISNWPPSLPSHMFQIRHFTQFCNLSSGVFRQEAHTSPANCPPNLHNLEFGPDDLNSYQWSSKYTFLIFLFLIPKFDQTAGIHAPSTGTLIFQILLGSSAYSLFEDNTPGPFNPAIGCPPQVFDAEFSWKSPPVRSLNEIIKKKKKLKEWLFILKGFFFCKCS